MRKPSLTLIFFSIFCLLVAPWPGFAATPTNTGKTYRFIENKKQWDSKILFQADINSGKLYLEKNAFTYSFYKEGDLEKIHQHDIPVGSTPLIHQFAYRMLFVGALPDVTAVGDEPESTYNNYFLGNDPGHWAGHVPVFHVVNYKGLYRGVDMRIYTNNRHLTYDYLLQPGIDAAIIKTSYEGADAINLSTDGNLIIATSLGNVSELRPIAYQENNAGRINVPCEYVLTNGIVSFQFPRGYDKTLPLIIDPAIVFATFSGSMADNWGYTATYDNSGNGYSGGIAFGTGYPTTVGSFQTTFQGGQCDVAIIKYDPTGATQKFATYLGGTGNEQPHSMVVDPSGNLCILGITGSADFPVSQTAYDKTFGGGTAFKVDNYVNYTTGCDIFVTKLSADGTQLVGSTYVGGSANDGYNEGSLVLNYGDGSRGEIVTDAAGNCLVASSSSSANFPLTAGTAQGIFGGKQDAVCFKLNAGLSTLTWSTYLGGSLNDAGYAIVLDANNGVFVTGGTESANFTTTAGTLHTTYQGGQDGFITHLSATGTSILSSTYLGTPQRDQSYFVQLDKAQNVYVYGQTAGSYPVTPASVYNNPNSGQFIHKLNNKLTNTIYATVIGTGQGGPDISPTAFLVDKCERVYIAGWGGPLSFGTPANFPTSTTIGLPITSNAYQKTTNNDDFYFMVLEKNLDSLVYGTFFGGPSSKEHVDGGTSRFDKNGIIYQAICGGCGGQQDMPTTPGCWSSVNRSSNCNNALVKFHFENNLVFSAFSSALSANSSACAPVAIDFSNESTNGVTYSWNFGDGQPASVQTNPTHTYAAAGLYHVRLVSTNLLTCNITDTSYHDVTINTGFAHAGPDVQICFGDSIQLQATGSGTNFSWSPSVGLSKTNVANPIASPTQTTTYIVSVAAVGNGCVPTDTIVVTVSPPPLADAGPTPGIICVGSSVTIGTPTHAGYSYNWSPGAGLTTTTGAQPGAGPTINTVYTLIVTDNTSHCTASSQVQVSVDGVPAADAGKNDTLCYGRKATLGAPATCPSCSYSWNPSLYLDDATKSDPVFTAPAITGSFRYTLSVTSVTGCNKTATVAVVVQAPPTNYAGFDQVTCSGSPITIGFDNNPNLSYAWTPATALSNANVALPKASPVNTTTYISTATDKATGCFATDTVVVRVNRPPVHAGRDTVICPGNFVHLGVAPLPNLRYKWKPSSGLSDSTASNPTATPTMSMTYVLTADDTITTCPASDTVLVTIAPVPVANAGGAPKSTCRNQSVVLGGPVNANFNYSWSPATGLNSLTGSNPVANPTVTTTYTLLVQDKTTHCFAADQIVVRVLSTPTAHAGNDTAICVGDAAVLGAVPEAGVNYSWSPAAGLNNTGFANPIAHPTITTTYTVTATNPATLCTDVDAVVITVNPIPAANAGVSGPVCLNDPHVLGIPAALPSYRYQWLPTTGLNNPTAAQPVVTVTGVVSYSVTVTDNNTHCFSTSTVHLTIVAKPVAYAGRDTTICPANPVPIGFNAVAGVTYSWGPATALDDPSSPHPVASPTVTTTYTVSATVGLCVATDQVVINVRPVVVNAGAAVTICPGHPVQLGSPAMSGYAYSWSPATGLNSVTGAQPMATPTATTTYTLTATNTANGCSLSAAVVVTVDDIGQSGAIADGSICQGGAISLGRVSNNATASYTWVAFPAGTVPAPLNNPLVSPTTTTSYYVTVNNGNCTTKDMVVITVNPTPVPDVAGPVTICAGDSVHLGNNNTHDVYSWSPPDGLDHTDVTNPLASPSVNMTYIVTVSNGLCGQTKAVPVTVALSTVSVVPAYTLCLGSSVQLSATGGTGYQWGADPGLNNYSIANPLASPSVTTTYMVTITSGSSTPGRSCSVVKSVVVRVSSAKLAIRNTPDTSVCKGGAIGLHVFANSPNVVYRWGSSNTAEVFAVTDSVLVVTPSVTTTYYVSGHSVFCNGPDSAAGVPVVVSVKEIRASVTAPVLCYGVSGVLTVVNPNAEVFRYKWFPKGYIIGSDTSAVLTVNPPVSTNYVVELTNSLGCKLAIPATVVVGGDATTAAYASKSSVYEGEQVVLNAQPQGVNYGYKWGPGVFLPSDQVAEVTVSPTITTTYVVQVSDLSNAAACIGGASVVVEVKQGSANCNPEDIFIPNTFTPNGDGKNDVLYVRSHILANDIELYIFNRWGEKVAEILNLQHGWDGTFNGQPAELGVYVYYLKYKCLVDKQSYFKKGNITLVR